MVDTDANADAHTRKRASPKASHGTPAGLSASERKRMRASRSIIRTATLPYHLNMNELVGYIQNHEEAFKSRNRIASLYADFREQQKINPDGFAANLDAWKKALTHATRAGVIPASRNLLILDGGNELARAVQHKDYGTPTCLRDVFEDAIRKKQFIPVDEWLSSRVSIYNKSWFNSLPKIPTVGGVLSGAWQLGKDSLFGPSNQVPVGSFVVVANVEAAATEIAQQLKSQPHSSAADRIFSKTAFLNRFGQALTSNATLSARDLDVLLVHMNRDRQMVSIDGNTIKFKAETESMLQPVSEEDAAMSQLHDSVEKVNARVDLLQAKVIEQDLAAREAVQLKQMTRAKTCLRSKKLAESSLEYHQNLSLQLEESYLKLQQAADQVGIVEAMQAGAKAMAELNKKVGGAEGVQRVVDSVNEEMNTVEEISSIINESAAPIDESEIDDEFAQLERAEKEKEEKEEAAKVAKLLAELPDTRKENIQITDEETGMTPQMSQLSLPLDTDEHEEEEERIAMPA